MILSISEVGEIEFVRPLHGEAYLIIPVDLEDGDHIDVKLSIDVCKRVQSYLTAMGRHIAVIGSSKPLGEPLQ
ncbi:hypothetical protein [Bradyrhizobium sp. ORS 111]|uniref:hypothetical protein n=1 Tax=Bradyrhizobium sp. ORS 111 TaxID=1685958 RepID=UPI00388E6777